MRLWFVRDIWHYTNVFWLIDWLKCREFNSWPVRYQITTLGKLAQCRSAGCSCYSCSSRLETVVVSQCRTASCCNCCCCSRRLTVICCSGTVCCSCLGTVVVAQCGSAGCCSCLVVVVVVRVCVVVPQCGSAGCCCCLVVVVVVWLCVVVAQSGWAGCCSCLVVVVVVCVRVVVAQCGSAGRLVFVVPRSQLYPRLQSQCQASASAGTKESGPPHSSSLASRLVSQSVSQSVSLCSVLTLLYLTFGVGRLLHLPSAEAVSVRPNAQPRCNQRSQWSAVKPNKSPATWDWWRVVWLFLSGGLRLVSSSPSD